MSAHSNYNKIPFIELLGNVTNGWENIVDTLKLDKNKVVAIECYTGINTNEMYNAFQGKCEFIQTKEFFKSENEIRSLTLPDFTDDVIFGYITRLTLPDFIDNEKLAQYQKHIASINKTVVVCGPGALLCVPNADLKIYADMAISGGAIIPPLMGAIAGASNYTMSLFLLLGCGIVIVMIGLMNKPKNNIENEL